MEKVIQKLNADLDEIYVALAEMSLINYMKKQDDKLVEQIPAIIRMKEFINLKEEEINSNIILFENFDILSVILECKKYKYNDSEIYKIIKYLVAKNFMAGIEKGDKIINLRKVADFSFEGLTKYEVKEMLTEDRLRYILGSSLPLTEKEQKFYDQIVAHRDELMMNNTDVIGLCNIILKEIIIDKEDMYSLEDINIVVDTLQKMFVTKDICESIRRVMEKKYQKRKIEENKKTNLDNPKYIYSSKDEKKYLTDAEYKTLLKKLKSTYDAYNVQLKKEITHEEMMEIVSIMIKLGYNESEVSLFVKLARDSFKAESTEIKTFIENYERYKYYFGKEELQSLLQSLEEMLVSTDEDYVFWKDLFLAELTKIDKKANYHQGYEYQLLKK